MLAGTIQCVETATGKQLWEVKFEKCWPLSFGIGAWGIWHVNEDGVSYVRHADGRMASVKVEQGMMSCVPCVALEDRFFCLDKSESVMVFSNKADE